MAREVKLTKAGYERLQQELAEEKKRLEEATRILQEQMEVTLGSVVVVQDEKTGESLTLQIVAPAEATVLEEPMRVSDESPLGKALLGHKEGDRVRVDTPGGKRRYRILSVGA